MKGKMLFIIVSVMMVLSLVLTACAPAVTPETEQPVEEIESPAVSLPEVDSEPEEVAEPEEVEEPAELKVLRYQSPEPQMEPNDAKSSTSVSVTWSGFVNDYLLGYTEDTEVIYMLAEEYEPNADYSVWTVKLRENAMFSDGTPLTTEDLAYSIQQYQDNDAQKAVYSLVDEVRIIDEQTAEVHLTEPRSDWLFLHPTAIYSKTCGDGCDFYSIGTPTSGPWMIKEYVEKSHMTMEKNPNYWGLKEVNPFPKIDVVNWVFQSDMTAILAALIAGESDYGYVVPKDVPLLQQNENLYLTVIPGIGAYVGFALNQTQPPFNDVRVRQAVSMLLEPEEKTEVCWDGFATNVWGSHIYQEMPGWGDLFIDTYKNMTRDERVEASEALLDEAGWVGEGIRVSNGVEGIPDGTQFSIKVVYESNWPQAECHTLLLKDWGVDAGLDFQPESYDPGAYWSDAIAGIHQMWHIGLPSGLLPYEGMRTLYHTDGTFNPYGAQVSIPELDGMIEAAAAEQDPDLKREMVKEVQDYLFANQFLLVDGGQSTVFAINSAVAPFYVHFDRFNSQRAWIFADINR